MQTGGLWNGADAVVVPVGSSSEELRYHKSIALQVWLYGYELPGKHPRISHLLLCVTPLRRRTLVTCRYNHALHQGSPVHTHKQQERSVHSQMSIIGTANVHSQNGTTQAQLLVLQLPCYRSW